uniref:Uncharacterized protein n=1 Tax=Timema poppense TaxID=170557 RepID=A0A7R9HEI5_TIMPO|nr:unnamed protein product [Timema poppensis]
MVSPPKRAIKTKQLLHVRTDSANICGYKVPSTLSALEVTILRVPESRFADVLDHATPIFLRDEPLSHCFQPCTTGRRERAFR